jgi:alpha-beta hydrolase superfamily lysophospholipase
MSVTSECKPQLTTWRGRGAVHFLLVPGLVPDGPETFARQMRLLQRHGDVTIMTYPYDAFCLDATLDMMRRFIQEVHGAGREPVLVGASVGGGFCLELMRRAREARSELPLAAVVLISPMTCADDLSPLLRRLLAPILAAPDLRAGAQALERGRTFFRALASRAVTNDAAPRIWRRWAHGLAPHLSRPLGEVRLRARITRTIEDISPTGGIDRCRAIAQLVGLRGTPRAAALTPAPTLILWGSKERHTLDVESAGIAELSRPDTAVRRFPQVEVRWIYADDGSEVPHASLLLHHRAFNAALGAFLKRRVPTLHRRLLPFATGSLSRAAFGSVETAPTSP